MKTLLSLCRLNKYEERCYTSLLQLGKATSRELCKASNVPYGRIYNILQSLEERGLISILPTKPKTFTVVEPSTAFSLILKKKEEEMQQARKDIEKIKVGKKQETPEEETTILKGKEKQWEMARLFHQKTKKEYLQIAGSFLPDVRQKISLLRLAQNGIPMKIIIQDITHKNQQIMTEFPKKTQFRRNTLPGLRLVLRDREEVLVAIVDPKTKERISIHTTNKAFASSMAQFFDAVWKESEKI